MIVMTMSADFVVHNNKDDGVETIRDLLLL